MRGSDESRRTPTTRTPPGAIEVESLSVLLGGDVPTLVVGKPGSAPGSPLRRPASPHSANSARSTSSTPVATDEQVAARKWFDEINHSTKVSIDNERIRKLRNAFIREKEAAKKFIESQANSFKKSADSIAAEEFTTSVLSAVCLKVNESQKQGGLTVATEIARGVADQLTHEMEAFYNGRPQKVKALFDPVDSDELLVAKFKEEVRERLAPSQPIGTAGAPASEPQGFIARAGNFIRQAFGGIRDTLRSRRGTVPSSIPSVQPLDPLTQKAIRATMVADVAADLLSPVALCKGVSAQDPDLSFTLREPAGLITDWDRSIKNKQDTKNEKLLLLNELGKIVASYVQKYEAGGISLQQIYQNCVGYLSKALPPECNDLIARGLDNLLAREEQPLLDSEKNAKFAKAKLSDEEVKTLKTIKRARELLKDIYAPPFFGSPIKWFRKKFGVSSVNDDILHAIRECGPRLSNHCLPIAFAPAVDAGILQEVHRAIELVETTQKDSCGLAFDSVEEQILPRSKWGPAPAVSSLSASPSSVKSHVSLDEFSRLPEPTPAPGDIFTQVAIKRTEEAARHFVAEVEADKHKAVLAKVDFLTLFLRLVNERNVGQLSDLARHLPHLNIEGLTVSRLVGVKCAQLLMANHPQVERIDECIDLLLKHASIPPITFEQELQATLKSRFAENMQRILEKNPSPENVCVALGQYFLKWDPQPDPKIKRLLENVLSACVNTSGLLGLKSPESIDYANQDKKEHVHQLLQAMQGLLNGGLPGQFFWSMAAICSKTSSPRLQVLCQEASTGWYAENLDRLGALPETGVACQQFVENQVYVAARDKVIDLKYIVGEAGVARIADHLKGIDFSDVTSTDEREREVVISLLEKFVPRKGLERTSKAATLRDFWAKAYDVARDCLTNSAKSAKSEDILLQNFRALTNTQLESLWGDALKGKAALVDFVNISKNGSLRSYLSVIHKRRLDSLEQKIQNEMARVQQQFVEKCRNELAGSSTPDTFDNALEIFSTGSFRGFKFNPESINELVGVCCSQLRENKSLTSGDVTVTVVLKKILSALKANSPFTMSFDAAHSLVRIWLEQNPEEQASMLNEVAACLAPLVKANPSDFFAHKINLHFQLWWPVARDKKPAAKKLCEALMQGLINDKVQEPGKTISTVLVELFGGMETPSDQAEFYKWVLFFGSREQRIALLSVKREAFVDVHKEFVRNEILSFIPSVIKKEDILAAVEAFENQIQEGLASKKEVFAAPIDELLMLVKIWHSPSEEFSSVVDTIQQKIGALLGKLSGSRYENLKQVLGCFSKGAQENVESVFDLLSQNQQRMLGYRQVPTVLQSETDLDELVDTLSIAPLVDRETWVNAKLDLALALIQGEAKEGVAPGSQSFYLFQQLSAVQDSIVQRPEWQAKLQKCLDFALSFIKVELASPFSAELMQVKHAEQVLSCYAFLKQFGTNVQRAECHKQLNHLLMYAAAERETLATPRGKLLSNLRAIDGGPDLVDVAADVDAASLAYVQLGLQNQYARVINYHGNLGESLRQFYQRSPVLRDVAPEVAQPRVRRARRVRVVNLDGTYTQHNERLVRKSVYESDSTHSTPSIPPISQEDCLKDWPVALLAPAAVPLTRASTIATSVLTSLEQTLPRGQFRELRLTKAREAIRVAAFLEHRAIGADQLNTLESRCSQLADYVLFLIGLSGEPGHFHAAAEQLQILDQASRKAESTWVLDAEKLQRLIETHVKNMLEHAPANQTDIAGLRELLEVAQTLDHVKDSSHIKAWGAWGGRQLEILRGVELRDYILPEIFKAIREGYQKPAALAPVLNELAKQFEDVSLRLYLSPEQKTRLETQIKELETNLGLGSNPRNPLFVNLDLFVMRSCPDIDNVQSVKMKYEGFVRSVNDLYLELPNLLKVFPMQLLRRLVDLKDTQQLLAESDGVLGTVYAEMRLAQVAHDEFLAAREALQEEFRKYSAGKSAQREFRKYSDEKSAISVSFSFPKFSQLQAFFATLPLDRYATCEEALVAAKIEKGVVADQASNLEQLISTKTGPSSGSSARNYAPKFKQMLFLLAKMDQMAHAHERAAAAGEGRGIHFAKDMLHFMDIIKRQVSELDQLQKEHKIQPSTNYRGYLTKFAENFDSLYEASLNRLGALPSKTAFSEDMLHCKQAVLALQGSQEKLLELQKETERVAEKILALQGPQERTLELQKQTESVAKKIFDQELYLMKALLSYSRLPMLIANYQATVGASSDPDLAEFAASLPVDASFEPEVRALSLQLTMALLTAEPATTETLNQIATAAKQVFDFYRALPKFNGVSSWGEIFSLLNIDPLAAEVQQQVRLLYLREVLFKSSPLDAIKLIELLALIESIPEGFLNAQHFAALQQTRNMRFPTTTTTTVVQVKEARQAILEMFNQKSLDMQNAFATSQVMKYDTQELNDSCIQELTGDIQSALQQRNEFSCKQYDDLLTRLIQKKGLLPALSSLKSKLAARHAMYDAMDKINNLNQSIAAATSKKGPAVCIVLMLNINEQALEALVFGSSENQKRYMIDQINALIVYLQSQSSTIAKCYIQGLQAIQSILSNGYDSALSKKWAEVSRVMNAYRLAYLASGDAPTQIQRIFAGTFKYIDSAMIDQVRADLVGQIIEQIRLLGVDHAESIVLRGILEALGGNTQNIEERSRYVTQYFEHTSAQGDLVELHRAGIETLREAYAEAETKAQLDWSEIFLRQLRGEILDPKGRINLPATLVFKAQKAFQLLIGLRQPNGWAADLRERIIVLGKEHTERFLNNLRNVKGVNVAKDMSQVSDNMFYRLIFIASLPDLGHTTACAWKEECREALKSALDRIAGLEPADHPLKQSLQFALDELKKLEAGTLYTPETWMEAVQKWKDIQVLRNLSVDNLIGRLETKEKTNLDEVRRLKILFETQVSDTDMREQMLRPFADEVMVRMGVKGFREDIHEVLGELGFSKKSAEMQELNRVLAQWDLSMLVDDAALKLFATAYQHADCPTKLAFIARYQDELAKLREASSWGAPAMANFVQLYKVFAADTDRQVAPSVAKFRMEMSKAATTLMQGDDGIEAQLNPFSRTMFGTSAADSSRNIDKKERAVLSNHFLAQVQFVACFGSDAEKQKCAELIHQAFSFMVYHSVQRMPGTHCRHNLLEALVGLLPALGAPEASPEMKAIIKESKVKPAAATAGVFATSTQERFTSAYRHLCAVYLLREDLAQRCKNRAFAPSIFLALLIKQLMSDRDVQARLFELAGVSDIAGFYNFLNPRDIKEHLIAELSRYHNAQLEVADITAITAFTDADWTSALNLQEQLSKETWGVELDAYVRATATEHRVLAQVATAPISPAGNLPLEQQLKQQFEARLALVNKLLQANQDKAIIVFVANEIRMLQGASQQHADLFNWPDSFAALQTIIEKRIYAADQEALLQWESLLKSLLEPLEKDVASAGSDKYSGLTQWAKNLVEIVIPARVLEVFRSKHFYEECLRFLRDSKDRADATQTYINQLILDPGRAAGARPTVESMGLKKIEPPVDLKVLYLTEQQKAELEKLLPDMAKYPNGAGVVAAIRQLLAMTQVLGAEPIEVSPTETLAGVVKAMNSQLDKFSGQVAAALKSTDERQLAMQFKQFNLESRDRATAPLTRDQMDAVQWALPALCNQMSTYLREYVKTKGGGLASQPCWSSLLEALEKSIRDGYLQDAVSFEDIKGEARTDLDESIRKFQQFLTRAALSRNDEPKMERILLLLARINVARETGRVDELLNLSYAMKQQIGQLTSGSYTNWLRTTQLALDNMIAPWSNMRPVVSVDASTPIAQRVSNAFTNAQVFASNLAPGCVAHQQRNMSVNLGALMQRAQDFSELWGITRPDGFKNVKDEALFNKTVPGYSAEGVRGQFAPRNHGEYRANVISQFERLAAEFAFILSLKHEFTIPETERLIDIARVLQSFNPGHLSARFLSERNPIRDLLNRTLGEVNPTNQVVRMILLDHQLSVVETKFDVMAYDAAHRYFLDSGDARLVPAFLSERMQSVEAILPTLPCRATHLAVCGASAKWPGDVAKAEGEMLKIIDSQEYYDSQNPIYQYIFKYCQIAKSSETVLPRNSAPKEEIRLLEPSTVSATENNVLRIFAYAYYFNIQAVKERCAIDRLEAEDPKRAIFAANFSQFVELARMELNQLTSASKLMRQILVSTYPNILAGLKAIESIDTSSVASPRLRKNSLGSAESLASEDFSRSFCSTESDRSERSTGSALSDASSRSATSISSAELARLVKDPFKRLAPTAERSFELNYEKTFAAVGQLQQGLTAGGS